MRSDELKKQFGKLQQADKTMFQTAEQNMDKIIDESLRVADVAHNSESILDDLDERFRKATGLTAMDTAFLFTAIGLQIARQYLLTKFPQRMDDKSAASSTLGHGEEHSNRHHRYYNPSLDEILSNPVPFDANIGANGALSGGGRLGHRLTAIGHDPLLGLIFGTANIATATLTTNTLQSYHIGTNSNNRDYFQSNARTDLVLGRTGEKLLHGGIDGKMKVGTSLIKEIIHLKSDLNTSHSLPLPGLSVLNPGIANELASYGFDMANVVAVGKQATLAVLINGLIAMIHRLLFDGTSGMDRKLYEVRTRKILSYSNLVASSSNAAVVAITRDFSLFDLGGLAVTVYQLITNRKFIRNVQDEFVFGSFSKMIQGDTLNLENYSYEDILNRM